MKYNSIRGDGVNFEAFWGALRLGDAETKPEVGLDLSQSGVGRVDWASLAQGEPRVNLHWGRLNPSCLRFPRNLWRFLICASVLGTGSGRVDVL